MLIAVDEDIPFAAQAFARFGAVRALKSREMTPQAVHDADALVVRSVTRVNAALLDGSQVRFIGTATSGVDHIDLAYLRAHGIAFADAAGANANAVAEYIVAALLHLRDNRGLALEGKSLGIIGFGHVGRCVARYASALGLRIVVNDPPLGRATCEPLYRSLDEVLACDIVTLHVPLERSGPDPTYYLVNDTFLNAMHDSSVLINTSRGGVADSAALKRALERKKLGALVLDVWENEPSIDTELARACTLATAHIAGHTLDAKIAAVHRLAEAFAKTQNVSHSPTGSEEMENDSHSCNSLVEAVQNAFDIAAADRSLRDTLDLPQGDRARAFDTLRAGWPLRREFRVRRIHIDETHTKEIDQLNTMGFRISVPATAGERAR